MSGIAPTLIPPPTAVDDTHKVYSIAIGCGIMCGVTTVVVLARLLFRWKSKTLGLDDYAFIPATLFYWGWSIMAIYVNLHAGVGKSLWEITLGEYSIWFQGIIGSMWLYPAMSFWIRVSILLFYRRLFATPGSRFLTVVNVLLVLQVVYLIVYSIIPAFVGRPLYKLWNPLERGQYMDDYYYSYTQIALYATSMAFDAILLFLPTWPLWKLQMPLRRRLSIAVVFMMGAAASVVAAWKLAIYVIEMYRFTHIDPHWMDYEMSRLIPPQFDTYGVTFWIPSQVEPTVALIGASMPALRHAFSVTAPQVSRFWTSLRSGSTQHTEQYGSFKAKSYQNLPAGRNDKTPSETEDTTRILDSHQPLEHPPRPYIQLQEWRS
ncbi:hypothetical protein KVR01_010724 [Diaporthe batatas]|uniref:uncharacterized protein n=1 Tax=Diaporthe batatas TaxID=748121 RepID=UPI001D0379B3|nr:uncharacterized protein KVR01_010724 [Diaporthe batatas]KAG8160087.1 hypothetical protein KVR01_010724 [Diaporthe batatas]